MLLLSSWRGRSGTRWNHFWNGSSSCPYTGGDAEKIVLIGVAIKGQNHELLGKFIFQYALRERGVGCIEGDDSESAVMWYARLLDSLWYKLIEILDTDELLSCPPRMIMSIFSTGMRQTKLVVGWLRWSGGGCSATPSALRVLTTCSLLISGPL